MKTFLTLAIIFGLTTGLIIEIGWAGILALPVILFGVVATTLPLLVAETETAQSPITFPAELQFSPSGD